MPIWLLGAFPALAGGSWRKPPQHANIDVSSCDGGTRHLIAGEYGEAQLCEPHPDTHPRDEQRITKISQTAATLEAGSHPGRQKQPAERSVANGHLVGVAAVPPHETHI